MAPASMTFGPGLAPGPNSGVPEAFFGGASASTGGVAPGATALFAEAAGAGGEVPVFAEASEDVVGAALGSGGGALRVSEAAAAAARVPPSSARRGGGACSLATGFSSFFGP